MRHHNSIRKFGRETGQRKALMKSLALSLIKEERIKTTEAKAKELRPFIEKLVSKGKEEKLSARRLVNSRLINRKEETKKLFGSIAPRYKDIKGGYTRIIKTSARKSDAAPMVLIELIHPVK